MPKSEKQKAKILLVAKYLFEYTDEDHSASASEILDYLENTHGIEAEEHSIYRDIAVLRNEFGLVIDGGRGKKYRLLSRQIKYEDLHMIIECIYASRFLTEKQVAQYIEALTGLCSDYQKKNIEKETYLGDRTRPQKSSVPKSAATIRTAIKEDKKISFKYLKASVDNVRNTVSRRNNAGYTVSPFCLLVNEGNSYLLGYSDRDEKILTYRVDRMKSVKPLEARRRGKEVFRSIDIGTYTKRVFGMYYGESQRVEMEFDDSLLDAVVDRLGVSGVIYKRTEGKNFIANAVIAVSPQFFAWIFGFGAKAKIIGPSSTVEEMKEFLKTVNAVYE